MSRSVGCGVAGAGSVSPEAESSRSTPMTPRNSSRACWAVARSSSAVSRTSFARQVGTHLQATGVQRHQRDPVREHVVHLARDARALGQPGLVGEHPLLGLGPLGPLAQRPDELPAGADEHAPCGDDGDERERDHLADPPGHVLRTDDGEHARRGQVERGQRDRASAVRRCTATVNIADDRGRRAPKAEMAEISAVTTRDARPATAAATTARGRRRPPRSGRAERAGPGCGACAT